MTTRSWLLISAESGRTIRAACGGQARLDHNRTTTMRRAVFAPGQPADESLWTLRRGPERRLPEPDHPLGGAGGGSAAEQAAQLQSLDFQPAQGYYFGVPRSGPSGPATTSPRGKRHRSPTWALGGGRTGAGGVAPAPHPDRAGPGRFTDPSRALDHRLLRPAGRWGTMRFRVRLGTDWASMAGLSGAGA